MKRLVTCLAFLLLAAGAAAAGPGTRLIMAAAGTGDALLLDSGIAAANWAVSMRLLTKDYSGPCLRLRRDSDSAEQDFGFAGGVVDTAAIATWLGGATGYVRTWYDQVGSKNPYQANTADQYRFHPAAMGSEALPSCKQEAGYDHFEGVGSITGKCLSIVGALPSASSKAHVLHRNYHSAPGIKRADYAQAWQAIGGVCWVNDVQTTAGVYNRQDAVVNQGSSPVTSSYWVGSYSSYAYSNGHVSEAIIWGDNLSAPDRSAVMQNQMEFFGLPHQP